MQYIVVGVVAVTVGFVLGYWIKALKYWNEKESVKTDSNVKEQAEIKDMKQKYDEVKARLDRATDKYKDLMVEMANDRFKRMLKKNRADSIATVSAQRRVSTKLLNLHQHKRKNLTRRAKLQIVN